MKRPTAAQQRKFLHALNELADIAEQWELLLPNGAMVDQLLGSIASDLQVEVWGRERAE